MVQARKKLCDVYGEDCISEHQCQRWFALFHSGNLNVHDAPHTIDNYKVKALMETNWRITTRDMAEMLDISDSTVYLQLQQLRYVNKLHAWVPYESKEIHFTKRINVCDFFVFFSAIKH